MAGTNRMKSRLPNRALVVGRSALLLILAAMIVVPIVGCEQTIEIGAGSAEAVTDKMAQLKKERKERCLKLEARPESERSDLENASLEYVNGQLGEGEIRAKEVFCKDDPGTKEDACVVIYEDGADESRYCDWTTDSQSAANCKSYGTNKKWGFGPVASVWQPYEICQTTTSEAR